MPTSPPHHDRSGRGAGLVVDHVTKAFGPTVALRDVSINLSRGAVHGLVGENGSGKSTLVKIIAGIARADIGEATFGGAELGRVHVGCVYQDGSVIDDLTVHENLDLMIDPDRRSALESVGTSGSDPDSPGNWVQEVLRRHGLDPALAAATMGSIPNNTKRLIEIVGVIAQSPDIILFDESTSTLDQNGVATVLDLMRLAAERGACVVIVTHRLREVLAVADDITVLRDGEIIGSVPAAGASEQQLVNLMAGRAVESFSQRIGRDRVQDEPALTAEGLVVGDAPPVDLVVRRGEILGIGGAAGNGQAELIRALCGDGVTDGTVRTARHQITRADGSNAAGVVFVSSDRRHESVFADLSIRENYALSLLRTLARRSVIARAIEVRRAQQLADEHGVVTRSIEQPISSLSGGNQQKVAIGRAVAGHPDVLLVEEPTEGVDVRSRFEIYERLDAVAQQGMAVVVTSSDASELVLIADRVLVLARRRIVADLTGDAITESAIVHSFATADGARSTEDETGRSRSERARRRPSWLTAGSPASSLGLLAVFLVVLGAYGTSRDGAFASSRNIGGICLLALPLLLAALAELPVLLTGQIDASLGSMIGLTVAVLSFFPGLPWPVLVLLAVVMGVVLGAVNGGLVVGLGVNPVIATIATLGVFEGIGLMLRSSPAGTISTGLTTVVTGTVDRIPIAFLLIAVICIGLDVYLLRTRRGLQLRAVGFSFPHSIQLGVPSRRVRFVTYTFAGGIAGLAGVAVATQTGVGDPTVGSGYTLLAIAIPVIGGAALSGGRGLAIGCVLGALFIAEVETLIPFINLASGYYLVAIGVLTLFALVVSLRRRAATI